MKNEAEEPLAMRWAVRKADVGANSGYEPKSGNQSWPIAT
jgi:hypothetical protein